MMFSACWMPGEPCCTACSQRPQLLVTILSTLSLTIFAYSSSAPKVVFGAGHVHVRARERGHVLDVQDRLPAELAPAGGSVHVDDVHAAEHRRGLRRAEVAGVEASGGLLERERLQLEDGERAGPSRCRRRRRGRTRRTRSRSGRRSGRRTPRPRPSRWRKAWASLPGGVKFPAVFSQPG